jgi:hypothetical protein
MNEEQQTTVLTETTPVPRELWYRKIPIVVAGGICAGIILFGGGLYLFHTQTHQESAETVPPDIEKNEHGADPTLGAPVQSDVENTDMPPHDTTPDWVLEDARDYSLLYGSVPAQEGVVWFVKPQNAGVRNLLVRKCEVTASCTGDYEYSGIAFVYYQIGTYFGNEILYTTLPCMGMLCNDTPLIFIGSLSDGYQVLTAHSQISVMDDEYVEYTIAPGITKNDTLRLTALDIPAGYSIKGLEFSGGWSTGVTGLFSRTYGLKAVNDFQSDQNSSVEFVETTPYGPLFRMFWNDYSEVEGGVQTASVSYGIRLQGGLLLSGDSVIPFMRDDQVPDITWLDGSQNETPYRGQLGGCGFGSPRVLRTKVADEDRTLVGYARTGEAIYSITNTRHPLIDEVFRITGGTYYEYNPETYDSIPHSYTREEFIAHRGALTYTDGFGLDRELVNSTYGPQAECAKPVIYLYPETTMPISVSVDALVTKSEPAYDGGWHVQATPQGELTNNGDTYTSLFWDGYGYGVYPRITEGVIVPTQDALGTMEAQLRDMGFNDTEVADFSTYWAAYMPSKPYTRITWFTTEEMEKLAKLTIDPQPDTLIRAFVDFEGLKAPYAIPVQKLPHYRRDGYVVTEWGGLLRHNEE